LLSFKVVTVVADLKIEKDRVRIIESAVNEFGRIDVLVNNAGICIAGNIEAVSNDLRSCN